MLAASKTAGASTGPANYIEDVFSTYLYAGNGATQTIANGIDLSTKGGLIWFKNRVSTNFHNWVDTTRGNTKYIYSNDTSGEDVITTRLTSFNTTGFSLDSNTSVNGSGSNYASWTFRKQPKFFDVVTYTGNGTAGRTISHNLGSVPACMIIKSTNDSFTSWFVYHTSYGNGGGGYLNSTAAFFADSSMLNSTSPTSTVFSVGTAGETNQNGNSYVAYLFASNAGGFGLTGTDNVITCDSFTTDGSGNATINLGYEPQLVLYKRSDSSSGGNWNMVDNMRGFTAIDTTGTTFLYPNLSDAELQYGNGIMPTSTGFRLASASFANRTYIYIAIRRGPMKVPTTATSVFGVSSRSGTGANATVTGGQTDDAVLIKNTGASVASAFSSRLTKTGYLVTSSTAIEVAAGTTILQANPWDVMDGVKVGTTSTITNASGSTFVNYLFKRAPSFMDVVCYTGTGSLQTQTHNLQAVPELMLFKQRSSTNNWLVYNSTSGPTKYNNLNLALADSTGAQPFNNTAPTSTVFTVNTSGGINASGQTYVAYLFATLAGVSKVGSYTGNGTTQTIDCGLTAGARFVLIKRTDSTGDWYVYDTARGMTTLTDPYWLTDSSAAEVATLGSVTTVATGFAVNSAILAAINVNAGTYIFLAIA